MHLNKIILDGKVATNRIARFFGELKHLEQRVLRHTELSAAPSVLHRRHRPPTQ